MAYWEQRLAWIKQHPSLSAVIAIGAFIFWRLPEWLGQVWPLFTNKTLPEWLVEQRWPGMSIVLYKWFNIVAIVVMLVLLGVIIYQQRNTEGREEQVATFGGPVAKSGYGRAVGPVLFVMLFAYCLYIHTLLRVVRGELNLVRDDMVRYVIPRSLTPEQKATVAQYVSKYTPHAFIMKVISRNEEANSYGGDLRQALEDGGWPTEGVIYDDAVPEGVRVEMSEPMQESKPGPVDPFDRLNDRLNPKKKPPDILREAFEQAGIFVDGAGTGSGTGITTTTITIFVGNRRHDKWAILPYP